MMTAIKLVATGTGKVEHYPELDGSESAPFSLPKTSPATGRIMVWNVGRCRWRGNLAYPASARDGSADPETSFSPDGDKPRTGAAFPWMTINDGLYTMSNRAKVPAIRIPRERHRWWIKMKEKGQQIPADAAGNRSKPLPAIRPSGGGPERLRQPKPGRAAAFAYGDGKPRNGLGLW